MNKQQQTLTARVDALESGMTELRSDVKAILAALTTDQPAKPAPARKTTARKAPARKAPAKKAPAKPATKGAQTRETLSRKDWNRTLTAKAKRAGGGTYKAVLAAWAEVTEMRDQGSTPDEVRALF